MPLRLIAGIAEKGLRVGMAEDDIDHRDNVEDICVAGTINVRAFNRARAVMRPRHRRETQRR